MGKIDKAILTLTRLQTAREEDSLADSRLLLVQTLVYLGLMLSVPLTKLDTLILFGIYPIISSSGLKDGYWGILKGSLIIIPFIALIGIFNPLLDHEVAFNAFGIEITEGWVTFAAIMVRGLFAMQALEILIFSCGFYGMCRAMRKLGVPKILTNQLMMVYRYLQVFLQELQTMRRARESRSFDGKNRLSLTMWSTLIGQLLLRTIDRAKAIHNAMLARGFCGEIPDLRNWTEKIGANLIIRFSLWILVFIILRFYPLNLINL